MFRVAFVMTNNTKATDRQEGGNHYSKLAIQPIEYCHANRLEACESHAIKYITRHKDKNGADDIKKAIHILELLLELEYGEGVEGETPLFPGKVSGEIPIAKFSFAIGHKFEHEEFSPICEKIILDALGIDHRERMGNIILNQRQAKDPATMAKDLLAALDRQKAKVDTKCKFKVGDKLRKLHTLTTVDISDRRLSSTTGLPQYQIQGFETWVAEQAFINDGFVVDTKEGDNSNE